MSDSPERGIVRYQPKDPVTGKFVPSRRRKRPAKRARARARAGRAVGMVRGTRMELVSAGRGATLEKRVGALEHNQTVLAEGIIRVAKVAGQALTAAYGRKRPRRRSY